MKFKKVRGANRRLRDIEEWVMYNKKLNLDCLQKEHRDYVKFRVRPWSDLVLGNGYEPLKGKLKQAFLKGLYNIFQ